MLNLVDLTRTLCFHCGLWRSLPFQACFATSVIPVVVRQEIKLNYLPSRIPVYWDRSFPAAILH